MTGIAPFALQRVAHPDGEVANAKAAGNMGVIFTLPTMSTASIEEVAREAPKTLKWAQLFIYKDKQLTQHMVERAEKAQFNAIVITVDAPVFGLRRANMRNKFNLPHETAYVNQFYQSRGTRANFTKKISLNFTNYKIFEIISVK